MRKFWKLVRDERAATAVEYGLICALIVVVAIASIRLVATSTIGTWDNVASNLSKVM